jgi:hypothetical protein
MPTPPTLTVRQARVAIVVWFAVLVVALTAPEVHTPPAKPDASDSAAFERMVERLRAGEGYYEATGAEMRRRGYPTASTFNWRTPLLMTAIAVVPSAVSQMVIVGLGVALIVSTWRVLREVSLAACCTGTVLEAGAVAIAVIPPSLVMGEAWAGLLLGLSVCAFARERRLTAIVLGALALFVRELAGAYCLVCGAIAVKDRRWRDVAAWGIAGVLYAVYYGVHVLQVIAHRQPGDIAHAHSWLSLGGVPFMLGALGWHAWLVLLPPVFTRLMLPLIVCALWSRRMVPEGRAAVATYLLLLLVAGLPFNVYWGAMTWPVWALGAGYAVDAVRDAVRVAWPSRQAPRTA